jgi:tetratricopeptide (TPR) repeat protein
VFAVSFVFFGVGNAGGLGFQDLLGSGSGNNSTSTSVEDTSKALQSALASTKQRPKDVAAWRGLGLAYTSVAADQPDYPRAAADYQKAVDAYKQARTLAPGNVDVLTSLAAAYNAQAAAAASEIQSLYAQESALTAQKSGVEQFLPGGATGGAQPDAITNARDDLVSSETNKLFAHITPLSAAQKTASEAALGVYDQLVKVRPGDGKLWFSRGQAAQTAGDTKKAVESYKRFLVIYPVDPLSDNVRSLIDQLQPKPTTSASTTTATTPTASGSTTATGSGTTTG